MAKYLVRWEMGVVADSPQTAALLAADLQRNIAISTVFDVLDPEDEHRIISYEIPHKATTGPSVVLRDINTGELHRLTLGDFS